MEQKNYTIRDFIPLIALFALIAAITLGHQLLFGWNTFSAMRISMAAFFIIFGSFKVINLHAFAQAYNMYDLIAKHVTAYGYIYPFIEIVLGAAYLLNWQPQVINGITLVIMLISAAGVFNELRKGSQIMCACLGMVFKVPMTYVTLTEDIIMAAMAAIMLLKKYL